MAVAVGRQDLTAHVDLTAVEPGGAAAGLDLLGQTQPGRVPRGAAASRSCSRRSVRIRATTVEAWLATRSAVRRCSTRARRAASGSALFGRGIDAEPALRGSATGWRADPARAVAPMGRSARAFALIVWPAPATAHAGAAGGRLASLLRALGASRSPAQSLLDRRARGRLRRRLGRPPAKASAGRMRLRGTARSRVSAVPARAPSRHVWKRRPAARSGACPLRGWIDRASGTSSGSHSRASRSCS